MDIQVLDNFLSNMYVDHLESLITGSNFPLYLNTTTLNKERYKKGKESPQFTHIFLENDQVQSGFMNHIEPIIFNFAARTEALRGKNIFRCKLNLNYKDVSFADDEFFPVHKDVDSNISGITALYYVNDADGDTLFFNNKYEIIHSQTPKKGTLVYFNNQILHAGQPPKKNPYRIVINFNWI